MGFVRSCSYLYQLLEITIPRIIHYPSCKETAEELEVSSNSDDMKEDFALITNHICEGIENKPDLNLSCVI
jgi:hypothetical protein